MSRDFSAMSVMVLEDEFLIALDLEDMLGEWGFGTVIVAGSLHEARDKLPRGGVDLLLADFNLTGEDSGELIAEMKARGATVVVLTGQMLEPDMLAQMGNPAVVQKPVQHYDLRAAVEAALPPA